MGRKSLILLAMALLVARVMAVSSGPISPVQAGIGFPPHRAASWGVIVATLLSLVAYYVARKRYVLSRFWSGGMLVFFASITVTIAAELSHEPNTDPWWLMVILAAAGLTLAIKGMRRKVSEPQE